MDLNAKKSRVVPQNYSSRQSQLSDTEALPTLGMASVDGRMLEMLKTLSTSDGLDFSELLSTHLEKIACDLRLAFHFNSNGDRIGLDRLAQQLAQNALRVGAVQILSSAIELQGLARWGEFSAIENLLGNLELEVHAVREELF